MGTTEGTLDTDPEGQVIENYIISPDDRTSSSILQKIVTLHTLINFTWEHKGKSSTLLYLIL